MDGCLEENVKISVDVVTRSLESRLSTENNTQHKRMILVIGQTTKGQLKFICWYHKDRHNIGLKSDQAVDQVTSLH